MDKREWRRLSEEITEATEKGDWQRCSRLLGEMKDLCEKADFVQAKRYREILEEKTNDIDRAKRRSKACLEEKLEVNLLRDEEKKGAGQSEEVKNLVLAMHKADQAIEEAIGLRLRIRGQGERLIGVGDRVDAIMEELPAIGAIMKKINRLDLRNQLVLHFVFYVCLYCLITSAF
jgi:hypothetical protein